MSFTIRLVFAFIAGFFLTAGNSFEVSAAPTAGQATRTEVQVDLFRGLADIFSRGMDSLNS